MFPADPADCTVECRVCGDRQRASLAEMALLGRPSCCERPMELVRLGESEVRWKRAG